MFNRMVRLAKKLIVALLVLALLPGLLSRLVLTLDPLAVLGALAFLSIGAYAIRAQRLGSEGGAQRLRAAERQPILPDRRDK